MSMLIAQYGCQELKLRILKNTCSTEPMVDFGVSFGGEATTRGMVSRIDVREGVIAAPESVTSQYLRNYNPVIM